MRLSSTMRNQPVDHEVLRRLVIVLVPILYAFSKIAGVKPIVFGLPMFGLMLAVHVAVPPHPGIVAGAGVFGADLGLITAISLPICAVLGILCFFVARLMNRTDYALAARVSEQMAEFGQTSTVIESRRADGTVMAPPSPLTVVALIAVGMVTYMIVWMRRHARDLAGDLRASAGEALL